MWFEWPETPCASKVRRTSIVAVGGRVVDDEGKVAVDVEKDDDEDVEEEDEGAKAETSTEAIFVASQVAPMSSGKSAESRTKTSVVERRPSVRALERSSVWRRGPRPSALPVGLFTV